MCSWGPLVLTVRADPALVVVPGHDHEWVVEPGWPLTVAVAVTQGEPGVHMDPALTWERLKATEAEWRQWSDDIAGPQEYRQALTRSLLTLRLLTYAPSGAPVASPTTSLPEELGGVRNWDYRFAWPRDASIAIAAALALGKPGLANAFLYWLLHAGRLHRPRLPAIMAVDGRSTPPEAQLEGWPGYAGSKPVRVGNDARGQHQLDGYGWVLDAAWAHVRAGHRLYGETWRMLSGLADFVARHWREPDAGIWEARDEPRHYVHSKLMGWLALDRALRVAAVQRTRSRRVRRWQRERDLLARDVRVNGFDEDRRTYRRAYGTDELDASLLLLPVLEFDPADSPRVVGTINAVRRELGVGGPLLHRYPPGRDGVAGGEGAFLPCSFWLVQALAASGQLRQARAAFDELLAKASPLGLLAEEMDPPSGKHLGNFPLAFTHGALIQAALAIERAESA